MSVSLEASKTPTPPSLKLNGRLHLNSHNSSKPGSLAPTPLIGTPIANHCSHNITVSSGKPLLDLSRASLQPAVSPASPSPRRPLLLSGQPQTTTATPGSTLLDSDHDKDSIYQMLASLALLCLLSLLMAFLALFFLQRIGPMIASVQSPLGSSRNSGAGSPKVVISSEEFLPVYQTSVALSTLTVALDLCCLFVCCIQFLFAIKLLKTPQGVYRTNKFLKRSSTTRVIAIGGFFLSIPIFFTGVILFTFIHFQEVPAIVTSVVIGIGIIFCGISSVQNVYLWQWEKTKASKEQLEAHRSMQDSLNCRPDGPMGNRLDTTAQALELSTLV